MLVPLSLKTQSLRYSMSAAFDERGAAGWRLEKWTR
jgi:hypothetical protein